jgi:hypothetical protein
MNVRIAEPLRDPTSDEGGHIVRELLLGRRRSRVPWVYVVYHRHARASAHAGRAWASALAAKERRDVER